MSFVVITRLTACLGDLEVESMLEADLVIPNDL